VSQEDSRPVYDVFHVSLGWCAAARSRKGICGLVLPMSSREAAEAEILRLAGGPRLADRGAPKRSQRSLRPLAHAIARCFDGWTVKNFDEFPLDLSSGTPFQQRVWAVIAKIPRGQVRTYRWIGVEIGRPEAVRAIGQAVGANPIPLLIPCHRVVGSDGALVGFSAAGGMNLKAKMLEIEKVRMHRAGSQWRVMA
jgi:O-6-methylguanine DNA methyltransferase